MDWLVGCLVWLYSFFLSSSLITQEHQKGVSCIELLLVCVLIRSTGVSRVTIPFRSIFAFFLLSYLFVSCLLLGGESFVSLYGFPLFFIFFLFLRAMVATLVHDERFFVVVLSYVALLSLSA